MARITIEGSRVTPTTFLAPGARVTVERTPYISNLIRRGYVDLVAVHDDSEPEFTKAEVGGMFGAPPETAAKAVWAGFLTEHGVEYSVNATKAQMIEAWEASRGEDADSATGD